jgi:hypothetical protein
MFVKQIVEIDAFPPPKSEKPPDRSEGFRTAFYVTERTLNHGNGGRVVPSLNRCA